ncbi:MAG: PadR family transcriptional regulator [Lachnospiraceae bacterium]|nr:PadR family transcriptional regulator [Lachnospiraceae bacterium]
MSTQKSHLLSGLKKATIEMLLLKMLSESDMYGYQLSQEIKKRSSGMYTILEGSMYPILYRLTEQGHISFYETKVGKRQTRVYYHLEQSGKIYLDQLVLSYYQYIDLISFLLNTKEGDTYEQNSDK